MTANSSAALLGGCPLPFLAELDFPKTGGFVDGRFCAPLLGPVCCLPCPQTDWLYPDNFNTIAKSTDWINVVACVCLIFLLISYAVLPVSKTHRHYLSICLVVAVIFMQLGFIIPLGARPEQCFNEITPNDMKTSKACAFSGAFLLAGGWSGVMWVFLRAVALHLQICWQVVLGKTFMWGSFVAGWGIPAIALTLALVFSGVSFRFGDTCHINHDHSLADFWIPLLVFAAITVIIQFGTFGYCIKVYLASLSDDSTTTNSSGLPSYTNSVRTMSPRQAYRRVRRVLELQWRGITIVLVIIADVIFFAVVFVFLDDLETSLQHNPARAEKWLSCLATSHGDKNGCLSLANGFVINEATVMAVLILLSINGLWILFLLGRVSMLTGWFELVRGKVKPNNEFVSADAGRLKDPGSYEMLGRNNDKTPEPFSTPVAAFPQSPPAATKGGRETPDYFGREARYKSPSRSFSAPKPPSSPPPQHFEAWDSSRTHAPPQIASYMDPLNMNKI